jgi:hypothetical protein
MPAVKPDHRIRTIPGVSWHGRCGSASSSAVADETPTSSERYLGAVSDNEIRRRDHACTDCPVSGRLNVRIGRSDVGQDADWMRAVAFGNHHNPISKTLENQINGRTRDR